MPYAVAPTEGLRDPVYRFEGDANVWSDWRKTVTLVKHLTRRHLAARYRGSALGFLWSLLNPILLMGVYTFVFTIIFRTSVPGIPYPVFVITGLLAWNFFGTAAMNAAISLVDGAALLKKTAFPLFALPVSAVLSNAINYLITLPLLIVFNLLFGMAHPLSLLLLPCLHLMLLVAIAVGGILCLLALGLWVFQRLAIHVSEV